jgi:ribosome-associated protein
VSESPQCNPPLEGGDPVAPGVYAPAGTMRFQYARSSGPGGQNVNKVNSKAELWVAVSALRGLGADAVDRLRKLAGHRLTLQDEIHIIAQTSRTQEANRAAAMERLRELILRAMHRPKTRRPTRPTRASKFRRLDAKRKRGQVKIHRSGGHED